MRYTETYRIIKTGEVVTTAPLPLHRIADTMSEFVGVSPKEHELISIDRAPFKFEIGDEVTISGTDVRVIVTYIFEDENEFSGIRLDGAIYMSRSCDDWEKTGRHIDILRFINGAEC